VTLPKALAGPYHPLPRGKCDWCGREVAIRSNGTCREHVPGSEFLGAYARCPGSGLPPRP
jgi:hypothetical protein